MKKKVLIIYGSYGSGHKTIAQYIKDYLEVNYDYDVKVLDFTENPNFIGKVGVKIFDFNIKYRTKFLFNLSYEFTDHKLTTIQFKNFIKKSFDNKNNRNIIKDFNPDITISTHFFGNNLVSYYNDIGIINSKIVTIITDYKSHQWWINNHKNEDAFIVANEIVKNELIELGVNGKKVYAFGLPITPNIKDNLEKREKVLSSYKLSGKKPIYLFFGGGSVGSMAYFEYFKAIANDKYNIDLVFICGKNKELKEKCDNYVRRKKLENIKVLGFTNDVFNLMSISNAVISKSGGATVTECLEMCKPMIIIPGYGGQEKYNEKFMLKRKFAFKARNKYALKRIVKKTSNNLTTLTKLSDRMKKKEKNNSTKKICELIEKM